MGDFKTTKELHEGLVDHGGRMGFKYGGSVKDTSKEFVQKTGSMDSMDHGVQPARKGRTQQDVEAGGTPKLKPKFKHGGKKKKAMKGGHMKSKANKKMPKNVKKKGGLAHASKYKHGGYNSEPMFGKD